MKPLLLSPRSCPTSSFQKLEGRHGRRSRFHVSDGSWNKPPLTPVGPLKSQQVEQPMGQALPLKTKLQRSRVLSLSLFHFLTLKYNVCIKKKSKRLHPRASGWRPAVGREGQRPGGLGRHSAGQEGPKAFPSPSAPRCATPRARELPALGVLRAMRRALSEA